MEANEGRRKCNSLIFILVDKILLFMVLIKGMFCSVNLVSFLVSLSDGLNQDLEDSQVFISSFKTGMTYTLEFLGCSCVDNKYWHFLRAVALQSLQS